MTTGVHGRSLDAAGDAYLSVRADTAGRRADVGADDPCGSVADGLVVTDVSNSSALPASTLLAPDDVIDDRVARCLG